MNIVRESQFQTLDKDIKSCHRCEGLNIKNITENAPGYGNLYSRIFIIGQSLCRRCMYSQIPFTGGSGVLLDKAFEFAKIPKSKVFITNVVHCHTPSNRKSLPHEIANCKEYLFRELKIIRPRTIIPLGQDAIISILGESAWPNTIGKKISCGHYFVYPLYHPSYIMKKDKAIRNKYINSLVAILQTELSDCI